MSIFSVNKTMVGEKKFAKMASEQDYYAYSIERLGLKLGGPSRWWEFARAKEIPQFIWEISRYYGWSSRELRFYLPLLEAILKKKSSIEFWLRRLGAPSAVWEKYGVELPDPQKTSEEKSDEEQRKDKTRDVRVRTLF